MKTEPKISVNKLVEYCFARSTRRTAIIEDIIKPRNYLIDTGYNDIERAIMHFASSKGEDCSRLDLLDAAFLRREAMTSHEETRLLTAHDAIELAKMMDFTVLPGKARIAVIDYKLPKFSLGGVSVSINPTNTVHMPAIGRKTNDVGLIKPYISKTIPLNNESGALMGALLHWYFEDGLATTDTVRSDLCLVYDIFAQKPFFAPSAYQQRRKLILAACVEISDRWDSIAERLETDVASKRARSK